MVYTKKMSSMPVRVIPNTDSDVCIVRCQCALRAPCGRMIKCQRCGCYSHEKCVTPIEPFTCAFCQMATERMLLDKFHKSATQSGIVVDHAPLSSALTGKLTPIQVCEVREHCLACGHVTELLDKLVTYLVAVEMSVSKLEMRLNDPAFEPVHEELKKELEAKRQLLTRHTTILTKLDEQVRKVKQEQLFLPALRDAIVYELL